MQVTWSTGAYKSNRTEHLIHSHRCLRRVNIGELRRVVDVVRNVELDIILVVVQNAASVVVEDVASLTVTVVA